MAIRKHTVSLNPNSTVHNTHFPHQFKSEMNAASRISNDFEHLKEFFGKFEETLQAGGLQGSYLLEMEPLKQLAHITILSRLNGSGVEEIVKMLFSKYGREGLSIVIAAMGCNPSLNKQEKIENIKQAGALFNKKEKDYPKFSDVWKGVVEGGQNIASKIQSSYDKKH